MATNITAAKPRFNCSNCQTHFWIPFPECLNQEEFLGFPVEWLRSEASVEGPEKSLRECPKCGCENPLMEKVCRSCGIVVQHYLDAMADLRAGFKVSRRLSHLWKTVLEDFESLDKHNSFIGQCEREKRLDYALYKYSKILDSCPQDEVSRQKKDEVWARFNATPVARHTTTSGWVARVGWSGWLILFALGLILAGYWLPAGRNLVGLGAALTFLAVTLRFYYATGSRR